LEQSTLKLLQQAKQVGKLEHLTELQEKVVHLVYLFFLQALILLDLQMNFPVV
jgi:hypothetical protein